MKKNAIKILLAIQLAFCSFNVMAWCQEFVFDAQGRAVGTNYECQQANQNERDNYNAYLNEQGRQRLIARAEDNADREFDYGGGIAINLKKGYWVASKNQSSASAIMGELHDVCGDGDCFLAAAFANTCVAMAMGKDGEIFMGDDTSPSSARKKAMNACKKGVLDGKPDNSCTASEKTTICSGYKYIDSVTREEGEGQNSLKSKIRYFKRSGSILGILAPEMLGISRLQKSWALLSPYAIEIAAQPNDVKVRMDPAAVAKIKPAESIKFYMTYYLTKSPRKFGITASLHPVVTEAKAANRCGTEPCLLTKTINKGCMAAVYGEKPDLTHYDFVAEAPSLEEVDAQAMDNCTKNKYGKCQVYTKICTPQN